MFTRNSPALKILGWVKLTCQFNSGSGHQVHTGLRFFQKIRKYSTHRVNSQKVAIGGGSDATMTPLPSGQN